MRSTVTADAAGVIWKLQMHERDLDSNIGGGRPFTLTTAPDDTSR